MKWKLWLILPIMLFLSACQSNKFCEDIRRGAYVEDGANTVTVFYNGEILMEHVQISDVQKCWKE